MLGSFRSAVADWNDVPTGSMKPTILEGDRVFVNKVAYDLKVPFTRWRISEWANPRRGDIVVLDSPYDGKRLVKRVIGLPGDEVAMKDHRLIVNGAFLGYQRAGLSRDLLADTDDPADVRVARESTGGETHLIMVTPDKPAMPSFEPVTVPPGQYLVMGDNRDNSFDSRWFGYVDRDRILGQVTTVVLSFDLNHHFVPRWDRFLRRLH